LGASAAAPNEHPFFGNFLSMVEQLRESYF